MPRRCLCQQRRTQELSEWPHFTAGSFAGLGFMSWYLADKIRVFSAATSPSSASWSCRCSLRCWLACHGWTTTGTTGSASGILGLVVASFCYLHFFPPPCGEHVGIDNHRKHVISWEDYLHVTNLHADLCLVTSKTTQVHIEKSLLKKEVCVIEDDDGVNAPEKDDNIPVTRKFNKLDSPAPNIHKTGSGVTEKAPTLGVMAAD